MEGILNWIEAEGAGHWFFPAFPVALLCLFIWFRGRRVWFLVPSLLISVVIVNPLFYKLWNRLGLYAYWRLLWVVPVIPIGAGTIASVSERTDRAWAKVLITILGAVVIAMGGTFLYGRIGDVFVKAPNEEKLPNDVVEIAQCLLARDESPRVIVQDPIGVYLRQYTADINTLFGREIEGPYIGKPSGLAIYVNSLLEAPDGDMDTVSQIMLDEDYDYLVYSGDVGECFELVNRVGVYGIYRPTGTQTVVQERNALGQVTRLTYVDENGDPMNGQGGYATVDYRYDDRNNVVYEFRRDKEGGAVPDGNGQAGYEREYDEALRVVMEKNLGSRGEIESCRMGYAEVRRTYRSDKLVSEAYYDAAGRPTNGINGYARMENTYDHSGNLMTRRFLDQDGRPTLTVASYAEKRATYDRLGHLLREEYFDADGEPCVQPAGYTTIEQTWDGDSLAERRYLDADGQPVNRSDGYSRVVWSSGAEGVRCVEFYDTEGNAIDATRLNLVKDVACGVDAWSEWFTPTVGVANFVVSVGEATLGEKLPGDLFICSLDIEFSDVTETAGNAFIFCTQGPTDGSWSVKNIWNNGLALLGSAPENGVYHFKQLREIDENNAAAGVFTIGFRCDYWGGGSFRVRNISVRRADGVDGPWQPGI